MSDTPMSFFQRLLYEKLDQIKTVSQAITSISVPTTLEHNAKNVTTAGTRVALNASRTIYSGVTVKAKAGNTGTIYVGNSGVTAANGFALAAGESVFLEIGDLATVYIDASVSGEGVTFIAS